MFNIFRHKENANQNDIGNTSHLCQNSDHQENNIYTWKCHNETSCIANLNKQKCLFSKMENRIAKQILSRG
jgi:hypothetical protein